MDDEISRLRHLLQQEKQKREEEQQKHEEEQRLRLEAESRALEEQRRREIAEEAAKASQPQPLQAYLEACHSLNLAIQIEAIWDRLSAGRSFSLRPVFPSPDQLEYVASVLYPIGSELGLRNFEHDTVENAIRKVFSEAYNDLEIRSSLDLRGTIAFESHTTPGDNGDETISQSMERLSVARISAAAKPAIPKRNVRKTSRRARGKGNRADRFCICKNSQGRSVPVVAIEYKPPHKLRRDEIITGLQSEIQLERDVIHKDGESYEFASRRLAAAVITELFSCMIGKGVQYGDPAVVYYHISVPNLDVLDDDENRLHRTAVSQVFAFILQAVRAEPPPESWHDAAAKLDTWEVEVDDVLKAIDQTPPPKKTRDGPSYKAQHWKGFTRSPIRTRSNCKQPLDSLTRDSDRDDDAVADNSHKSAPASPSPNHPRHIGTGSATESQTSGRGQVKLQAGKEKIQDRPFCTQECLMRLAHGGPLDMACPNVGDHKREHISPSEFLRLIRDQLATDRGRDADCAPLYLASALGALFKLRLSSHSYTLVAKGMEDLDLSRLQHKHAIYNHLQPIQGEYLPIYLGMIDLVLPYYYNHSVYTYFLFLGWGRLPLAKCINQINKPAVLNAVSTAYKRMHLLGVLHLDAEPRNILYNVQSKSIMIIDFEKASIINCQPLGLISPNGTTCKGEPDPKEQSSHGILDV
ncbi:hypothetical protein F5X99DRAFT_415206 [Biscogniauxia marginata]|nr:hypothetical protein F5X99DRAFT_415206 [Biscogniauxia marginata]